MIDHMMIDQKIDPKQIAQKIDHMMIDQKIGLKQIGLKMTLRRTVPMRTIHHCNMVIEMMIEMMIEMIDPKQIA